MVPVVDGPWFELCDVRAARGDALNKCFNEFFFGVVGPSARTRFRARFSLMDFSPGIIVYTRAQARWIRQKRVGQENQWSSVRLASRGEKAYHVDRMSFSIQHCLRFKLAVIHLSIFEG